jgi:3'-phosphoadenosine 5'-phosphosulfate sulfotransferase (PAPS reductase)/FAD synthetase
MRAQHFVSISGGKDSTATMLLCLERLQRRPVGNLPPRFLFCDVGNEHPLTLEHVEYLSGFLERETGLRIETVRADFSDKFAARREAIARDWLKERQIKKHTGACREACSDLRYAEKALVREECDCPVNYYPPVPERIPDAIEVMQPTGNPFLDMCLLHGVFPSKMRRFCTQELKILPMEAITDVLRMNGVRTVSWIGERADESPEREKKPELERNYCAVRAPEVLYRPIHKWSAEDTFAIARRHGLKPNPLYTMGMKRVGCMPCIMAGKDELREIFRRFPDVVERLEEWEALVSKASRRGISTFMAADKIPGKADNRAHIRAIEAWTRTGRGGRQFDMMAAIGDSEFETSPDRCVSRYSVCE